MLGDNIKRLMKANGYKQKELAIRSGCTESAISKYANNEREPSIKVLKNLAISLGVTVDELLGNNATADVVEVVRCKDCSCCVHGYPVKAIGEEALEGWYCRPQKRYVQSDDFCSFGERKEED